jgi:hypothetical protein
VPASVADLAAPSVRVRLPVLSDGRPTPREVPVAAPMPQRTRERPTAMDLPPLAAPPPALRKPMWPYLLAGLAMLVVGASLAYVTMRLLLAPAPEVVVPTPERIVPAPSPVAPVPVAPVPVAPQVVTPAVADAVASAAERSAEQRWTHEVAGTAADPDAPFLALRQSPTGAAPLLEQMPDGTRLRVEERQGNWLRVVVVGGELAGRTGWANTRWLKKAEP